MFGAEEGFDPTVVMQKYADEIYERLNNLTVHETVCQANKLKLSLLSPSSLSILQRITWDFYGVRILPFMFFEDTPSLFAIDHQNVCGFGNKAIVQIGKDLTKSLLVSPSISDFLGTHVQRLKANWYNNLRGGMIESYPKDPCDPGAYGSVTITKGIRVSACASYNHTRS